MRTISLLLVFVMTIVSSSTSYAQTKMISTLDAVENVSVKEEREKIVNFLESEFIQKEMINRGVDPREAIQRVAHLSKEEVRLLAQEIDRAPAGGDVGGIIGTAVFIFLVLLITDILGFTKVFPFTRSIR